MEKKSKENDDSDSDDRFPSTQQFQTVIPKGEVFWNFDSSPAISKQELLRRLEASDSPESSKPPLSPSKPFTSLRRLRIRPRTETKTVDAEGLAILKDLEDLIEQKNSLVEQAHEKSPEPAPSNLNNTFGSSEDSFLIRCTQAVENEVIPAEPSKSASLDSNENTKLKEVPKTEKEESSKCDDLFNDSFDSLLSQMPMPKTPQQNKSFKKIKSADDIPVTSTNGMTLWKRSGSAPEANTPKCSKEEIQKKRLEAKKRSAASKRRKPR